MSVWFVLAFTVCVTYGSVNKLVCISLIGSSLKWDREWEYVLRQSVVRSHDCERSSVFLSCQYMRTNSVSTYFLSSVCFKWHMCIVKWHTYLWGANKQPNTNTGFFLDTITKVGRLYFCSDFAEHNTEMHTTWRRLDTIVYSSVSVSPWQSPAPLQS